MSRRSARASRRCAPRRPPRGREAERAERLQASGAGAEAVAERSRFAATRARAERAEAEAALETLLSPRPEDLALAEAEAAAAEAAVARARAEAGMARLRAPIAGTVLRVLARGGRRSAPMAVLELADLSAMDVVAEVFETDLPRLRPGAVAEILCRASRTASTPRCARSAGRSAASPRRRRTRSRRWMRARWKCA
jgi:multidrug resistance efflux pump